MEPIALLNGRLMPQSQATLALNDAGFVMGATVTDLCRTFCGVPYLWTEHLARFRRNGRATYINVSYSDEQITSWAMELIDCNNDDQELALVLFATPGPVGYYLGQQGSAGEALPTFGMHTFPLPFERYRSLIEHGASLVVPPVRQVPTTCVDPRIKQRSRLHWWLAQQEAGRIQPGTQALLLDTTGHLTETAAANFLIVHGGVVISPPRDRIMGGVSLEVVEEFCARLGIAMEFRPISLNEALIADEAMLTSTPYCLAGIREINGTLLPWPGAVFRRLIDMWSTEIGINIHAQIIEAEPRGGRS